MPSHKAFYGSIDEHLKFTGPKQTEQQILNAVYETLLLMQIPVVHVRNTGAIMQRNGKTFFGKSKFNQNGVPDLIACVKGYAMAIELKSETGRLSMEQIEFLDKWVKAGGEALVARSVDDVLKAIEKLLARRKEHG